VKNQYFGDIRDLFKYDLITEIIKGINEINQFTFIPMLTQDDSRSDGNLREYMTAKAGYKNNELVNFLSIHTQEKNDFRNIETHFETQGIKSFIYNGNGSYFTKGFRQKYFSSIDSSLLQDSLIFLDPDNGLEIKKSNEKHVLYSEVKSLYNRMGDNSALMIIQFFGRQKHIPYIKTRINELRNLTNSSPLFISDNSIVFFFLTKAQNIHDQLASAIKNYCDRYGAKNLFCTII
jgi:hypothetical protein